MKILAQFIHDSWPVCHSGAKQHFVGS